MNEPTAIKEAREHIAALGEGHEDKIYSTTLLRNFLSEWDKLMEGERIEVELEQVDSEGSEPIVTHWSFMPATFKSGTYIKLPEGY